ncbi:hypothetical protein HKX48_000011 [Thoreauomyces humboldtii]|nr:hypothetical protein HKX48_000011 [Thoreauomyces humboldtii]
MPHSASTSAERMPEHTVVSAPIDSSHLLPLLRQIDSISASPSRRYNHHNAASLAGVTALLARYKRFREASNVTFDDNDLDSFRHLQLIGPQKFRSLITGLMRCRGIPPEEIAGIMNDMSKSGISLESRDWARLILAYGRAGNLRAATDIFDGLRENSEANLQPDRACYHAVLEACAEAGDASAARRYLEMMRQEGLTETVFTILMMMDAHVKAGDVKGAKPYWDALASRVGCAKDAVERHRHMHADGSDKVRKKLSRNIYHRLMERACDRGEMTRAVRFYNGMVVSQVAPVSDTFSILLVGHAKRKDAKGARAVLARMRFLGIVPTLKQYSILIDVHGMTKDFGHVEKFLRQAVENGITPDLVLYNILIKAYGIKGDLVAVEGCYHALMNAGLKPDPYTFATIADAHAKSGDIPGALHWIETSRAVSVPVQSAARLKAETLMLSSIVAGHCRLGDLSAATAALANMRELGVPATATTYTTLATAYMSVNDVNSAARLLETMQNEGVQPDGIFYRRMIEGFARRKDHKRASALANAVRKGALKREHVAVDEQMGTTLLTAALARGDIDAAWSEFEELMDMEVVLPPVVTERFVRAIANVLLAEPESANPALTRIDAVSRMLRVFAAYRYAFLGGHRSEADTAAISSLYHLVIPALAAGNDTYSAETLFLQLLVDAPTSDPGPAIAALARCFAAPDWMHVGQWTRRCMSWAREKQEQESSKRHNDEAEEQVQEEGMRTLWDEGLLADTSHGSVSHPSREPLGRTLEQTDELERRLVGIECATYGLYCAATGFQDDAGSDSDNFRNTVQRVAQDALRVSREATLPLGQDADLETYWHSVLVMVGVVSDLGAVVSFVEDTPVPSETDSQSLARLVESILNRSPPPLRSLPTNPAFVRFGWTILRHCEMGGMWQAHALVGERLRRDGWKTDTAHSTFGPPAVAS